MAKRTVHALYEVDGVVGADVSRSFTGDESGATPGQPISPGLGGNGVDPDDFDDGQFAIWDDGDQKLIGTAAPSGGSTTTIIAPAANTRRTLTIAASRSIHYFSGQLESNGVDVAENSVITPKIFFHATALSLEFGNIKGLGQVSASNPIQVACGVRVDGVFHRVMFGSLPYARIPVNGKAFGYVNVEVEEGSYPEIFTFVEPRDADGVLISGGKWPAFGIVTEYHGEAGERVTSGGTDKSMTGGFTGGPPAVYGPTAIRALNLPTTKQQRGEIGDSIVQGVQSTNDYLGYPAILAGDGPLMNLAIYGEALSTIISDPSRIAARLIWLSECDEVGINYGSNDLSGGQPVSTVQTNLMTLCGWVYANGRPLIEVGTVLPRPVTSSDGYETVAGQNLPTWEAARVLFNTWLLAGMPVNSSTLAPVAVGTGGALLAGQVGHPVFRVIDRAAAVESAFNSGKWRVPAAPAPLLTTEGSHPEPAGDEALAEAIRAQIATTLTTPSFAPPPAELREPSTARTAMLALEPAAFLRLNEPVGARFVYDQVAHVGARVFGPATFGVAGPGTDGETGVALGSTGFVEIPDHALLRRLHGWTLLAWIKVASVAAGNAIAVKGGPDGFKWLIQAGNGFQNLQLNGTNNFDNGGDGTIPLGSWVLLAASYASSGAVRFYVNGAPTASTNTRAVPTGPRAYAGAAIQLGRNDSQGLNGSMAGAAYVPRVLTPSEVAALYAAR